MQPDIKMIEEFHDFFLKVEDELYKVVVGQKNVIRNVLVALFSDGHVLLEGAPGLGKTLLVKSLGEVMGLKFRRIQFTPDLMPADVIGTNLVTDEGGSKKFVFQPGPVFANIILADEINRATPKTQSAFLEAMAENQVTVAGHTYKLDMPFLVLATQNPIEMEGTYPLPEAQLDRFRFKLNLGYIDFEGEREVIRRTTGGLNYKIKPVLEGDHVSQTIENYKSLVREVLISSNVEEYIVRLLMSTRPNNTYQLPGGKTCSSPESTQKYVEYGASTRGAQAVVLAAKVLALLDGRANVSFDGVFLPSLRHRLILNYEAEVDGKTTEEILEEIQKAVKKK